MIRGATFPIHLSPRWPHTGVQLSVQTNTNYEQLDPKTQTYLCKLWEMKAIKASLCLASYLKFSQSSLDKIQRYFQKIGQQATDEAAMILGQITKIKCDSFKKAQ